MPIYTFKLNEDGRGPKLFGPSHHPLNYIDDLNGAIGEAIRISKAKPNTTIAVVEQRCLSAPSRELGVALNGYYEELDPDDPVSYIGWWVVGALIVITVFAYLARW